MTTRMRPFPQARTRQPSAGRPNSPNPFLTWVGGRLVFGPGANAATPNATNRLGVGFNPPTTGTYVLASSVLGPTASASLVVVMSRVGAAQTSHLGSDQLTDRFGVHLPFSDSTVYFDFGGSSAPNRISVAAPADMAGAWVFTAGPLGMRMWKSGALLASSSTAISRGVVADDFGFGIQPGTLGGADTGATYNLFHIENNQFSDGIARQLSLNPWRLFAPLSVWAKVSAPAPAAPVYGTLGQFDPGMRIAGWF